VTDPVLSIRNLSIDYVGAAADFHAVKNVSFDIGPREFFGLAGESGCGKSTIAFAISRLLRPPALILKGSQIRLGGRDVLALDDAALRDFRWREVAMVFQSAMNSLNPVLTIESQFYDVLKTHTGMSRTASAQPNCWRSSISRPTGCQPIRTSFRAACASASSSPSAWRSVRSFSSWTNPPPHSTLWCSARFSNAFISCASNWGFLCCSSPTISLSWCR
jgi:ABC-type dipeptide/oligopeptide/nickel transport system ATPase component